MCANNPYSIAPKIIILAALMLNACACDVKPIVTGCDNPPLLPMFGTQPFHWRDACAVAALEIKTQYR